jgi:hypothetical protein
MLREESVVLDGLPGDVVDIDVGGSANAWVAVCKRGREHVVVSPTGVFVPPEIPSFPVIRWITYNRFLLVDPRTKVGRDNAWILSDDGELLSRFCAGDGIQDIPIASSEIVVTYFDEGVFVRVPPSDQGVCVFSQRGDLEFGYSSYFVDAVDVADCYCACLAGPHEVCFSPYTAFPLVRLNLRTREQIVYPLPEALKGAAAMTTDGVTFYFYAPYKSKHTILAWEPDAEPRAVGSHPGPFRFGGRARFLSAGPSGYTLVYPGPA